VLKKHGAVSDEIAILMAKKVRSKFKTDFGIGIAGPTGGSRSKSVGLVFVAVHTVNEALCLKCQFSGTRQQIKKQATQQALALLWEFLDV